MTIIWKTIAAFICVCGYGFVTETPKKLVAYAGVSGAICWFVYLVAEANGGTVGFSCFLAALFVALYSHIMARAKKTPVTMFFLGGILPLVPGSQIYQSVRYFIRGEELLFQENLTLTLLISGAIALAIFIMDTVFQVLKKLTIPKSEKNL